MAQFGKASAKRGKPSYIYAIIGVSLVLFLFGICGWFFMNIRKMGESWKESIQAHVWIKRTATKPQIDSLHNYLKSRPFIKNVEYVTREAAIKKYEAEHDTTWREFLQSNPLEESIDFTLQAQYMEQDSLNLLNVEMQSSFSHVISEFQYPTETITKVSNFVKNAAIWILIIAIILSILVIISIDNTIRLAMYSNRFLIKTMQMVGATRWFIAKPLDLQALINGFIAAVIAIGLLMGFVFLIELYVPDLKALHDNTSLIMLSAGILILGLTITLLSTHRSVLKYLRMKLDDLY
jgi:cell division transport system permease protein